MKFFDVDNCAYCKHMCLTPIRLDTNDFTQFKSKVVRLYVEMMKDYSSNPLKIGKQNSSQVNTWPACNSR